MYDTQGTHSDPTPGSNRSVGSHVAGMYLVALWLVSWCLIGLGSLAISQPATAQLRFGSADDPREAIQRLTWKREQLVYLRSGPSLIGAQWRVAADIGFDLVTRSHLGRFEATTRVGVFGEYDPDVDEWYDALRTIHFLRYRSPQLPNTYLRLGPLTRVSLGTGHLVDFFSTRTAWDDRRVGLEGMQQTRYVSISAFTDNLLLNGITGGRIALRPFAWAEDRRTRSFTLGLNMVTDLATRTTERRTLEGYNVELLFSALASGTVQMRPFVSYAWYTEYGNGLSLGAELRSDNFVDLARFHVKMAIFYNGGGFIPGYIGPFYMVNNPYARVVPSTDDAADPACTRCAGTALSEAFGANAFTTEVRVMVFERFELWYLFRRHYGTQPLSEYRFHLFIRNGDLFTMDVGLERGELRRFLSLFNDLGDLTHLSFRMSYQIRRALWLHVRARYSYETAGPAVNDIDRYIVQRRFEPMLGFRLIF